MIKQFLERRFFYNHITAYINGELDSHERRRITQLIDSDDTCYAEYRRQLALNRDLSSDVPVLGQTLQPSFDAMWSDIVQDMELPNGYNRPHKARYSLLSITLALVIMVPLLVGNSQGQFVVPSQPPPKIAESTHTLVKTTVHINDQYYGVTPIAKTAELVTRATPTPKE